MEPFHPLWASVGAMSFADVPAFDDSTLDDSHAQHADAELSEGLSFPEDALGWAPTVGEESDDIPNFDPGADTVIVGDPESAMEHWHLQDGSASCAVVSQEFVLEELTGQEFDEADLAREAQENGWYEPGVGTPAEYTDKLLEAHGIPTETRYDATIDDISQDLEEGNKVLVSVDSSEIWDPGMDSYLDESTDPVPGQGADHMVEVIGIVDTPEGRMVVLNDPGSPDGCGEMVPIEEFEDAWADSGNFAITAGPTADDSVDAFAAGSAPTPA